MEIIKSVIKTQVVKFILAGAFCAAIEFLSFNILISHFKVMYLVANVISIIIAVTINYLLSNAFVFEKSRHSKINEIISFFLFAALALLLNQIVLWFWVEIVKFDVRICKALAIIIVAAYNYLTKKYIVFKPAAIKQQQHETY